MQQKISACFRTERGAEICVGFTAIYSHSESRIQALEKLQSAYLMAFDRNSFKKNYGQAEDAKPLQLFN